MNQPSQATTTAAPEEARPVRVQRMLRETADLYEQMALMVRPGVLAVSSDLGKRIKQSESLPAPADLYVIERMRQLEDWARGLREKVKSADVRDVELRAAEERARVAAKLPKPKEAPEPVRTLAGALAARDLHNVSLPVLLRWVADVRIGAFVPGDDVVGAAFEVTVRHWRKFASETVEPTARRWRDMKVQCVEVIDDGEAMVECKGTYGMWVNPHYQDIAPDLQCSIDAEHRVTPSRWQRAGRRSGYRPDAIRERLQRERLNS